MSSLEARLLTSPERSPIDDRFGNEKTLVVMPLSGVVFASMDLVVPDEINRPGPDRITAWVNQVVANALAEEKDQPSKALAGAVYDELTKASRYMFDYEETTLEEVPVHESLEGILQGSIAELAVHNLLWWGVAHGPQSSSLRYARYSTTKEDRFNTPIEDLLAGQRNANYDHVLRSDRTKWKIQTKRSRPKSHAVATQQIFEYTDDVTVIYADQLHKSGASGIHRAVARGKHDELAVSWERLVHELRTQKTKNGGIRQL